ncbi:MAG: hypothetical protein IMY76_00080 [Chloroflexi bacterium]|nr:hypothetical protein [Chloroflexota bacterium]
MKTNNYTGYHFNIYEFILGCSLREIIAFNRGLLAQTYFDPNGFILAPIREDAIDAGENAETALYANHKVII